MKRDINVYTQKPSDHNMMMNGFSYIPDDDEIRREKNKARELRATQWWKRKRAKGFCHYCNKKFPAKELTMDHVVPIAKGGKSTKSNVVPCCKTCNTAKKSRLMMEWQPDLSPDKIK